MILPKKIKQMFNRKKAKRSIVEAKSANEKRKIDLEDYDNAMITMKTLFTNYHKSLNGLLTFYKGFSDQLRIFYDKDCSYFEYAEKASSAFATAAKVLSENVSVLLGLEDIIKLWSTAVNQAKPAIKAFEAELKKKLHYQDKLLRLKADQELSELKNITLTKKKTTRISRVFHEN